VGHGVCTSSCFYQLSFRLASFCDVLPMQLLGQIFVVVLFLSKLLRDLHVLAATLAQALERSFVARIHSEVPPHQIIDQNERFSSLVQTLFV
jgi:hypothetical protein